MSPYNDKEPLRPSSEEEENQPMDGIDEQSQEEEEEDQEEESEVDSILAQDFEESKGKSLKKRW